MFSQFIDSTAPFDFVAKNGYYQIGNSFASHIGPACQEATKTNQPIQWHFGNEVYNNFNWRSRLNVPLTDLYRLRAQQLRDKYDYLILLFSGGADSTTILQSFIHNGIHLDEVMVSWPRTLTEGRYTPNLSTDSTNMSSEWDFSIEPKLKWLAKNHPTIKITVLDHLIDPVNNETYFFNNWTLVEKYNYFSMQRQFSLDKEIQDRYKKYKNIASIIGSAPTEVAVSDNKWLTVYFRSDMASSGLGKSDYLYDGTPRNVEYFFWTPDFPDIVREQGHVILNYLNAFPSHKALFYNHSLNRSTENTSPEMRRQLIKKLIYPEWDQSTFQVKKATQYWRGQTHYTWFFSLSESDEFLAGWKRGIKLQESTIDKKFFTIKNGDIHLPVFLSRQYPIGRLENQ